MHHHQRHKDCPDSHNALEEHCLLANHTVSICSLISEPLERCFSPRPERWLKTLHILAPSCGHKVLARYPWDVTLTYWHAQQLTHTHPPLWPSLTHHMFTGKSLCLFSGVGVQVQCMFVYVLPVSACSVYSCRLSSCVFADKVQVGLVWLSCSILLTSRFQWEKVAQHDLSHTGWC